MMPKNSLVRCTILTLAAVLRKLSQRSFYNSRVLERSQSRVPLCEEDVGAFIVMRPFLLSLQSKPSPCKASLILAEQVFFLQSKSSPCSPSLFLAEQVFKNLKRGGQVWALVLSGAPHKEWARPFIGPWTWACWAHQALSHILSSSAAPFTPFGPSLLCKRSIGVTVKTNNHDGPTFMGATDRHT